MALPFFLFSAGRYVGSETACHSRSRQRPQPGRPSDQENSASAGRTFAGLAAARRGSGIPLRFPALLDGPLHGSAAGLAPGIIRGRLAGPIARLPLLAQALRERIRGAPELHRNWIREEVERL